MATSPAALYEMIVGAYHSTKYVNYFAVGGLTMVIADYLHTFPDEVRLMWPASMSLPKVLFFVVRYYSLLHGIFSLTYSLPTNRSAAYCTSAFVRVAVSTKLVIIASEAILLIRVYAFAGKDKIVLAFIGVQFVALHVAELVVLGRFIQSVKFMDFPLRNLVCIPAQVDIKLLGVVFSLLLCSVSVIMLCMVYVMFRKYRNLNASSLSTMLYQDGLVYFLCLSGLAVANLIVIFGAKNDALKLMLAQPEAYMHAILSTRMILRLRSWSERAYGPGSRDLDAGTWAVAGLDYYSQSTEFSKNFSAPRSFPSTAD
ncbi:hypothetical protein H1R20_g6058, partial [Candolleomyces eurysporus]